MLFRTPCRRFPICPALSGDPDLGSFAAGTAACELPPLLPLPPFSPDFPPFLLVGAPALLLVSLVGAPALLVVFPARASAFTGLPTTAGAFDAGGAAWGRFPFP